MLKLAVVGIGVMGTNHARNYTEIEGVKLVGVCDVDSKRVKDVAHKYKTKAYVDFKKLLSEEKPDAVSIAVPTTLHKDIALYFIKNNIPVLIEKPIAPNLKDAEKIINEATKRNVKILVGHIERFNPAIIKLQELVKENYFGDVLSIVVKRVGLFPSRIKDVNVVTDLAVHDLDIVRTLTGGLPKSILAKGGGSLRPSLEDHAEIFLDYGNFGCFIQVNWITPIKIRNIAVTGSKGYAEVNYITQKLDIYKAIHKVSWNTGFEEFVVELGESERVIEKIKREEPLRIELEHFVNLVQGREKAVISDREVLDAILLTEATNQSISKGKSVKLRP